jgi:hypothetical protein
MKLCYVTIIYSRKQSHLYITITDIHFTIMMNEIEHLNNSLHAVQFVGSIIFYNQHNSLNSKRNATDIKTFPRRVGRHFIIFIKTYSSEVPYDTIANKIQSYI